MKVRADFSTPALVHFDDEHWSPSPMSGVDRLMLDRIGSEVARATSIVRYAPGSAFSAHVHTGGEEFLVLDGVFSDEHGDFPAGSYVRNPPTSSHTPRSEPGCVLFVKLWQFDLSDRTQVLRHLAVTDAPAASSNDTLHLDSREHVRFVSLTRDEPLSLDNSGGLECLVIRGTLRVGDKTLRRWSWLRLPAGQPLQCLAGQHGARVWIKTGHLTDPVERFTRAFDATKKESSPDA